MIAEVPIIVSLMRDGLPSFYVARGNGGDDFRHPASRTAPRGIARVMRLLNAAALVALVSALCGGTARAALCTAAPGGRVVLESDAVDPDVFLWDSRTRLVDYSAGQWGNTRAIFAHTVLAQPGTQAAVISCVPAVARPAFSTGQADAIGVKIVNGPYRGRYGWVLSSDIRLVHGSNGQGQSSIVKTTKSER